MLKRPSFVVEHAARLLEKGELVAYPTETYYALGADALSAEAVERVVNTKGRAPGAPLATIAPDMASARRLWREVPAALEELARKHWPGALTIVAPAADHVPRALVSEAGKVGVRVSSHPWAASLVAAFGGPVTATSANRSGEPPPRRPEDVLPGVHVLRGGTTPGGAPSTLVDVDEAGHVRVLRAGGVMV